MSGRHKTLTKRYGKPTTTAMAAGIAQRPWSVFQIAELLDRSAATFSGVGPAKILLIFFVLVIGLGPPILAYRDMKKRGRSDLGLIIVLAMVFVWPVGFVLWFIWHDRYARVIDLPPRVPTSN